MASRIPRITGDEAGAAVIELALVAPMLALLTVGVIDISNAYSRKLALEQGAQRAIEKIMQTTGDTTVEDTLKVEAVCQVNGTNQDGTCKTSPITTANVTVSYRLECTAPNGTITSQSSTVGDTFDDMDCAGATDREAKYLEVTVTDKYTPMFSTHFMGFTSGDGSYHLSTTAGMRTK
jgi:Flp pilus assembly protein TadG